MVKAVELHTQQDRPESNLHLATLPSPQRSSWALQPKVGNGVENEFPGPSCPGVRKLKNRVEKESKKWKFQLFSTFLTLFQLRFLNFSDPRAGRPRELIFNSVSNFGPEGPKNSSGGMEGRNLHPKNHISGAFQRV